MKSTSSIREAFLNYFSERGHQIVASGSLVPGNDPTLLFTNAGMVPFKDVFLGAEQRNYTRATSSQRCVRAGGKHNDLDQVGYTARHHTFFEMLGNFSFGDYFKYEAIKFAWDFLTDVLGLSPAKLWITVYDEDAEAETIWLEKIGIQPDRLSRIGAKDNFWSMGDTGPCGPCTEIFYDHGPEVAGGPPGSADEDGDRYIEIWNIVFMQFDRDSDGNLLPLPAPSVDTGMGLERIAAVMQGVHSNYQTDLFQSLILAAAQLTHHKDLEHDSLKVIADHIRACAFLIADGVLPSNEGRGYVLRRIIRRAIRHGYKLGHKQAFFARMVAPLVKEMGQAYPILIEKQPFIETTLAQEESRFAETLTQGMQLLEKAIAEVEGNTLAGKTAFKLYDTYGFPLDLTEDVVRERGLGVDQAGFKQAMQQQREQAKAASRFQSTEQFSVELIKTLPVTEFLGYEHLQVDGCRVVGLLVERTVVDSIEAGQTAIVVLDKTPFYAESGGQVGDIGTLISDEAVFAVSDTLKIAGTFHAHVGKLEKGRLVKSEQVTATVDEASRKAIILHHSATHLLHAALREVLGDHVQQKGSLVAADRLRFDFSHPQPMSVEQVRQVEDLVNQQIRHNAAADIKFMAYDQAIESGAMALFGEKYAEQVRVLKFGDFSTELCGGTHVTRLGDIGLVKIVGESGIAAGVRRIEALAGSYALTWVQSQDEQLQKIAAALKAKPGALVDRLQAVLDKNRESEKQLQALKSQLASASGDDLLNQVETVEGIKLLVRELEVADVKTLRDTIDQVKQKIRSGVVVLAARDGVKVKLAVGVTGDLTERISAGELVADLAAKVDGRGGGRADFAQAGGVYSGKLKSALDQVKSWIIDRM